MLSHHLSIPYFDMKKILIPFQYIGKMISKLIVALCLLLVYLIVVAPYSLFIRFNRNPIYRNRIYDASDLDRMFWKELSIQLLLNELLIWSFTLNILKCVQCLLKFIATIEIAYGIISIWSIRLYFIKFCFIFWYGIISFFIQRNYGREFGISNPPRKLNRQLEK